MAGLTSRYKTPANYFAFSLVFPFLVQFALCMAFFFADTLNNINISQT